MLSRDLKPHIICSIEKDDKKYKILDVKELITAQKNLVNVYFCVIT